MKFIEGIIIKNEERGESDRLITLISNNLGKAKFIARGGRKIEAKIAPHLDLFNMASIGYVEGKYYRIIVSARSLNRFESFNNNILKLSGVMYLGEIFDRLTIFDGGSDLFELIYESFLWIDKAENLSKDDLNLFLRYIEYKILKILGFTPIKEYCLNCAKGTGEILRFSVEKGGVLCERCVFFADRIIMIKKSLFYEVEKNNLSGKSSNLDDFKNIVHGFLNYYAEQDVSFLNSKIFEIIN